MATLLDAVITPALKEIGVLAIGETPTAEDAEDARVALNQLIDQWAAEGLTIYTVTRSTWTITANDGSYTVGSSADVNITRPVFVEGVSFLETSTDPDHEYPLDELTEAAYAAIPEKALTSSYPTAYYYNPTYPTATLTLYPVPTSSTLTGVIYHKAALGSFSALSTSVSVPPAYERMLRKQLAVELIPTFGRQPDQLLIMQAREAKEVVKRANKRLIDLTFEPAAIIGARRTYNINSDR